MHQFSLRNIYTVESTREGKRSELVLEGSQVERVENTKVEAPKSVTTMVKASNKKEVVLDVREAPVKPLVVVVVSSMPRSGSTLFTELLSALQDSVVLFEPLWLIEKQKCFSDESCVKAYLNDVFSCNLTQEFQEWLKAKTLFFRYFSPEARRCMVTKPDQTKEECLRAMDLRQRCEATPVLIIKVIRARLTWMETFLSDSSMNMKVIHLTRDPRGSINSIIKFGWYGDPFHRCKELNDDMDAYYGLVRDFPDKVMQLRYEQLCLRPQRTTRDVLSFLFGNATLPAPVSAFLDNHMLSGGKKGGNMNTYKNSTLEFEAWRYKIKEKHLAKIEKEIECVVAIRRMGHAVFKSGTAAQNTSIPLINFY